MFDLRRAFGVPRLGMPAEVAGWLRLARNPSATVPWREDCRRCAHTLPC